MIADVPCECSCRALKYHIQSQHDSEREMEYRLELEFLFISCYFNLPKPYANTSAMLILKLSYNLPIPSLTMGLYANSFGCDFSIQQHLS
jgi:hypothetical protein